MSESRDAHQSRADLYTPRLHFLTVELEVGNTMLDVAAGTRDDESRLRRRARAQEAHDEVERQLAKGDALGIALSDRERIAADLARLRERLATA